MSHDPVAVLGGGACGLAAACTLAGRGYSVLVFNTLANKHTPQTFITNPRDLDRIFRECNRKLGDYLDLHSVDPQFRCTLTDGRIVDFCSDLDQTCRNLEKVSGGSGADFRRFIKSSQRMLNGLFSKLGFPGRHRTVASHVHHYIRDPQIAHQIIKIAGLHGYQPESPANSCQVFALQMSEGIWRCIGPSVNDALHKLAMEMQVGFRDGHDCRIQSQDGRVTSVSVDNDTIRVRAVVSSTGCDSGPLNDLYVVKETTIAAAWRAADALDADAFHAGWQPKAKR